MTRIQALIPTSDMPTTGTASYTGTIKTDLRKRNASNGTLPGEFALTVDFAKQGQAGSVTGKATNLRKRVNRQAQTCTGKLIAADAADKGLPSTVAVTTTTIKAPIVGPITTRFGGITTALTGDPTVGGVAGAVVPNPGGSFVGSGGQAMHGPVVGPWWSPAGIHHRAAWVP